MVKELIFAAFSPSFGQFGMGLGNQVSIIDMATL